MRATAIITIMLIGAEAAIEYSGEKPQTTTSAPPEKPVILTPPPAALPRINGPSVFGIRPGHPVLYHVPVTGERPMEVSVEGLAEGLTFDPARGVLTGTLSKPGSQLVTLRAKNRRGHAEKKFD